MTFPTVNGSNLQRAKLTLPQDFEGDYNLLFIAFQQWQQDEVNTWIALAENCEARFPGLVYYELPTIRVLSGISKFFINEGMRAGIPNQHAPRRVAVVRESMRVLAARAKASDADALLYGGDDNIDEDRGSGWGFMRRWATGLRLVRPPGVTHGSRTIDNFRVKGLKPLRLRTIPTPGDHRAVVGEFRFR